MPTHCRVRVSDRDPIRGGHYGQRSCEPHTKAAHMAAPTRLRRAKKSLPAWSRSLIADLDASIIFDQIISFVLPPAAFLPPRPQAHRPSRADAVKTGRLRQCCCPGSWFSTRSVSTAATSGPKRRRCNVHNELTPKRRRGPTASVAATYTFAPRGNTLRCAETANGICR